MGEYLGICPRDDGSSRLASDWYARVSERLGQSAHVENAYVSDRSPVDYYTVRIALREAGARLALYFGHGTADAWIVKNRPVLQASGVDATKNIAVVSVACNTGKALGLDAINIGAVAWLGFTCDVPVIAPHGKRDPLGDAIVEGIAQLANGQSMAFARATLEAELRRLVEDYKPGGRFSDHPGALIGRWACELLADHVSLAGQSEFIPL